MGTYDTMNNRYICQVGSIQFPVAYVGESADGMLQFERKDGGINEVRALGVATKVGVGVYMTVVEAKYARAFFQLAPN